MLIVDGSNLGGALGGAAGGRRGARDRVAVVRSLLPRARGRGRVVVVFDGPPDPAVADAYGPLAVRWSGRESADEVILRLVAARPREAWVVTEDRALARACRDLGARWLRADELQPAAPSADAEPEKPQSAGTVEEWEEWFRRGGG